MRFIITYVFTLFVFIGATSAQASNNPFELKHRKTDQNTAINNPFELEKADSIKPASSKQNTEKLEKNINPFDVLKKPNAYVKKQQETVKKKGNESEDTQKESSNYLFWVILFVLLFFATVVSVSRKRLEQTYRAFWNDNFLRQLYRSNKANFNLSYLLLYILFFINAGIFTFLAANTLSIYLSNQFSTLLILCLSIAFLFLLKHILLFFLANIFPIEKEINLYRFTIIVFSIILGIILLPINVLIAYAPLNIAKLAVYLGLGAILATYGFRSLRGLSIGSRYIMLHKFHFLLYLCAVEILPIIVLLKIILLRID